jgi:ABC-type amino acid transport substrate-binding protein
MKFKKIYIFLFCIIFFLNFNLIHRFDLNNRYISFFKIIDLNSKEISKKIIFGIEFFPPFCYIDQNKRINGFSIELSNIISKKLNKDIEFKLMNFEQLFAALNSNIVDIVIDSVQNKEREKNFIFSDAYIENQLLFIVKQDKFKENNIVSINLDEAVNKKFIFGLIPGVSIENFLRRKYPEIKLNQYPSLPLIFEAFKRDKIDSFINMKCVIDSFVEKNNIRNIKIFYIDSHQEDLGLRFMFKKNNNILRDEINNVLQELKGNGMIECLKDKYNL